MQWVAVYSDGSTLPQYHEDGTEAKYADIDRTRLESFALLDGERVVFHLHLDEGQRLIYRRRVEQSAGGEPLVVYMVGWQQTVNGSNVQSIAYVHEDGRVELAGRWRDDRWHYAIQPLEAEA